MNNHFSAVMSAAAGDSSCSDSVTEHQFAGVALALERDDLVVFRTIDVRTVDGFR